jgi:hypothetical protein
VPVWSDVETYFGPGDPSPVYAQESGAVRLVYFDTGHEMIYNAAARWFASDPGSSRRSFGSGTSFGSHQY